jgi:hypothetical protein
MNAEIAIASRDYPIAFVTGDGERSFLAMAILGLEQQQNLFVDASGAWDGNTYVPAYVRRYPFCMARVTADGTEQTERIACVEKAAVGADGDALYDDKGVELPAWQATKTLLFEFEADLTRTEEMCATLKGLGLLEPFSVQAMPREGAPLAMTGMHRVAEQKLAELPAGELRTSWTKASSPASTRTCCPRRVLQRVSARLLQSSQGLLAIPPCRAQSFEVSI